MYFSLFWPEKSYMVQMRTEYVEICIEIYNTLHAVYKLV